MSGSFSVPRWGASAVWASALALVLVAFGTFGAARADAAFTTAKCDGADITGRGASFARDAHNVFINNFEPVFCGGVPSPTITYEALGSGAGRLAVKVRNDAPRFGMSDEPPTPAEIAQMDAGTGNEPAGSDANPNDNGLIHVVPAAVGAVPPLVNFPDNCDVSLLPEASRTAEQNNDADATPDDVMRVRFTKAQFEQIWEKDPAADSWHEVFPALAPDADCQKPIIRVVRFDDSGTSFTFKDYLNTIDGAEGWLTTYVAGANKTREWPGAVFGARADCAGANGPGSQEDSIDQLTSGCANGNGPLVAKLVATDGSIGYSDVSTARSNSPSLAITPEANDNDTYWTQVQNGSNTFTEPTSSANGFRTDGPKGANCNTTTFTGIPSAEEGTLGDWSKASGVNSPAGFGICTLTYGLVFDDNADVWGSSPAEEAKARTVVDYWENVVSAPAQAALFPNDYAPLPAAILNMSRAGIAEVDWEKGEGGTDPDPEHGDPKPDNPPVNNPAPPAPPSNLFSLPRKSISSSNGGATISVKLPGAGKVELVATAKIPVPAGKAGQSKQKTIKVGKITLNASKAGTYALALKPSAAAMSQLRKKGSLRVSLALTFTPTGGSSKSTTTGLTLKLNRKGK